MTTEQQNLPYDLGKPWELNSLLTIGLTTRPLLASLRFFSWHSSHISLKGLSASIETLAYFLLTSLIILSRPPKN
jgi:hypothetical protein